MSEFVIASPDVSLMIQVQGGTPITLTTGTELSYNFTRNTQDIFAIGSAEPIQIVSLNSTYTGGMSLQTGEYQTLLDAINSGSTLYASLLQVPSFTMSWSYAISSGATPRKITMSLLECKFSDDNGSVSRNDPETISQLSFRGIGVQRSVSPL